MDILSVLEGSVNSTQNSCLPSVLKNESNLAISMSSLWSIGNEARLTEEITSLLILSTDRMSLVIFKRLYREIVKMN